MRESSERAIWWERCGWRNREAATRRLAVVVVAVAGLLLGGCSAARPAMRPGAAEWVATASWYGPKYDGRPTASGEIYDMNGLTAAHRSLPFGTRLRVTYPSTGKSVVVKVNDRGPFVRGRELDLSYGAAQAIGLVQAGVARVSVQRLR